MKIPILIEPAASGYTARAGEPFGLSAEGGTEQEAADRLRAACRERLRGGRLALLDVSDREPVAAPSGETPEEWVWRTMLESIAENRRLEDLAGE